jgi:hypothetical protein
LSFHRKQLCELEAAGHPLGALMFASMPLARRAQEAARCATMAAEIRAQRAAAAAAAAAPRVAAVAHADADADADADAAAEADAEQPASADGLWRQRGAPLRIFSGQPCPPAAAPPLLGVLSALRVSRVGQFSCPLACGALVMHSVDWSGRHGTTPAHARAALLATTTHGRVRALDDIITLEALREAAQEGRLPPILRVGTTVAGVYAEFAPRPDDDDASCNPPGPWPVAWFAFISRAEAATRAQADDERAAAAAEDGGAAGGSAGSGAGAELLDDEDRFDVMHIPLSARHAGNVACVTLIASENLMSDWQDDHPEPNVDVSGVAFSGALLRLPPGSRPLDA